MRKALITGITGQDGSYLAELLVEKGYEVHGIVRRVALEDPEHHLQRVKHLLPRLKLESGSLESFPSLLRIVGKVQPDECYHLAAQSYVSYSFEDEFSTINTNINGTHYMLAAVKEHSPRTRFYFAASSEMFGKVREVPQTEETPFHPRSAYGISKVAGFHLTRNYREAYNIFALCGILFNHESPRRGYEFVTRKITSTAAKIKLGLADKLSLGNLDAQRDWGFAGEYVEAMWRMLQLDSPQDLVIATGETHTVREFVEFAFQHVGLDWQKYVVVDKTFFRPSEVNLLLGNADRAAKVLDWRPTVRFPELVRMMVDADLKLLQRNAGRMSDPSLRILVVNHRDWRSPRAGGLEELVAQSCRRWAAWGHEVTLLCARHEGAVKEDHCDGVRMIHGTGEYLFNWWAPFKIRSFGPGRFDVILEYISKVPCFIPAIVRHTPVAVMVPHLFGKTAFNELPWPMAAYAYALEQPIACVYQESRFWALSKTTASDLVSRGVSNDQITVIYPGFNEALLKPLPVRRTPYPSLIYLTRLKKYKRVDLPIRVVARLKEEFPGLRLFITGRGDHEPELRRLVAELKVENAVEFCGFVSEERKQELMQLAWLGIQTSTIEGWGLGVIEVGACGVPTVASDSPGLCESVHDGKTGTLVPHGDVEALVTAVRRLLADHAERERLGANAYQWAQQLSWEEMSRRSLDFLRGSVKQL